VSLSRDWDSGWGVSNGGVGGVVRPGMEWTRKRTKWWVRRGGGVVRLVAIPRLVGRGE